MNRTLLLGFSALFVCCMAGCKTNQAGSQFSEEGGAGAAASTPMATAAPVRMSVTNQLSPELLVPSRDWFTLGPGDKVEIEVIGHIETRAITFVGPDGKLYYHLLPGLDVWGLTLTQARDLIEKELGKYLTDPQVAMTLREISSKHVWVLGRLNKPGIYPLTTPTTLLESIALAGGSARSTSQVTTEELADLRHSFVMRQGQHLPVDFYRLLHEGDTSQNIYLQPDDFVYVPSALSQEIYVLGAVRFPRTVPYSERMTLVSAIAGASGAASVEWLSQTGTGGPQPDAFLSHVAIVRGSLSQPQITIANYGAIVKGREADIPLEPGDIIYVPNAPYSTLKRYLNTIVNTFITTVAANEGIRAGGGQVSVGVSVPVGR